MIDPDRYFPPGPVSGGHEPARNPREAEPPAVPREKLAGGCVLYRPLRFAGRVRETRRPNGTDRSSGEAQSQP